MRFGSLICVSLAMIIQSSLLVFACVSIVPSVMILARTYPLVIIDCIQQPRKFSWRNRLLLPDSLLCANGKEVVPVGWHGASLSRTLRVDRPANLFLKRSE